MELLDIRNKDGSITGETKERELVHQDGDIHGTSHVWIIRKNKKASFDVLLQLRSLEKEAFPDCYDISSAGHIPAGQDYLISAMRELEEELGIKAKKKDLKYIGMHFGETITEFYNKPFINHEISKVFIYDKFIDIDKLQLQKEEVQSVRWMDYSECCNRIKASSLNHCIFLEEILMVGEAFKKLEQESEAAKLTIANNRVEAEKLEMQKLNNQKKDAKKLFSLQMESLKVQDSFNGSQNTNSKLHLTIKKCGVKDTCGGCQYQGVSYKEQLKNKQSQVEELFKEICPVKPIVGMDNPYNYRNKVHAIIGEDRDHQIISGIYKAGTHFLVPVENCFLEDEKADEIIATLRKLFKSFKLRPYNEDKQTGIVRHVLIKRGFQTNEIMVVIVTATQTLPSKNKFLEVLRKSHPEITTIVQNINDRKTSMVLGEKENIWYGKGYIEDILCGCSFRISAKSFYQINPVQTEILYKTAIQMANLTGEETIIDAYCGIGTIGIVAALHARKVIGIELNKDAVKDAISNAKRNNISNCKFYQGDAGQFMMSMSQEPIENAADVVILDPPRSGSTEEFLSSLVKLNPNTVIYISCNPETQMRDVKFLERKGYKAMECRPFDMFPFTEHVESVLRLERRQ